MKNKIIYQFHSLISKIFIIRINKSKTFETYQPYLLLYIIFLSCLKEKEKKNLIRKDENTIRLIIAFAEFFLCPIVNRRERPLEIQGRRVESIKRGVHILTRKKDIRRLCVHRVCIRRKEREREEERRLARSKQNKRGEDA